MSSKKLSFLICLFLVLFSLSCGESNTNGKKPLKDNEELEKDPLDIESFLDMLVTKDYSNMDAHFSEFLLGLQTPDEIKLYFEGLYDIYGDITAYSIMHSDIESHEDGTIDKVRCSLYFGHVLIPAIIYFEIQDNKFKLRTFQLDPPHDFYTDMMHDVSASLFECLAQEKPLTCSKVLREEISDTISQHKWEEIFHTEIEDIRMLDHRLGIERGELVLQLDFLCTFLQPHIKKEIVLVYHKKEKDWFLVHIDLKDGLVNQKKH